MTDDESQNPEKNPEDIENLIQDASQKLKLDIDWMRKLTPQDVLYLIDHCPFLQMINPDATGEGESVKLILADSGWMIHDYGDAMSSSPGELLFAGGDFRIRLADEKEDEGGEGGSILNPGKGTFRKQAFDTATQMAEMAANRNWAAIRFVDGHPLMQRAAWIRAEQLGLKVIGFTPDKYDKIVRDRIQLSPNELESRLKFIRRR